MKRVYRKDAVKRMLILQLGGVGDLVLSTPALAACRQGFPQAYIGLAVMDRAAQLGPAIKSADRLVVFKARSRPFDILDGFRNCWENTRTIIRLRRERYDLLVNLEPLGSSFGALKMRFLLWLIAPGFTAGRDTDGRGKFLDIRADDRMVNDRHEVLADLAVVRSLDEFIPEIKSPELSVPELDKVFVSDFLKEHGAENPGSLIGLNPGSFRTYGRWFGPRWAELADKLADTYGCRIIIIGIKKERPLIKAITGSMKHKGAIITAELGLSRLAGLLSRLDLFITNDSGPMHMAAAMGTPVVAIFGPGDIKKFAPFGPVHQVVRGDIDCPRPCYKFKCGKRRCMESIAVKDVFLAAQRILGYGKSKL